MKKLMTTVSAVALAFGLYATDTGTSFEGLTGDAPYDIYASTGELTAQAANQTYWVTNGTETLTVVAGTSDAANRPAPYEDATQTRYLNIKTTLGNPVTRNVSVGGAGTSIGAGFYFDSLVKFTAFDEDPAINLNGGKLAVWIKEVLDANDNPTATNLVVTAGFLDGQGGAIATNYTCTVSGVNLNDGGWHRVTVKAIADITNGGQVPGFVVYVDTVRATSGAEKGIVAADLSTYAYLLNSEGSLFPSAVQSGQDKDKIAAVAFDGQGDVDDLLFTDVAPDFAKDATFFSIYLGEHVTSVQGYDPDGNVFTIGGATNFVYGENKTVEILDWTCDTGWMKGSVTNEAGQAVSGSYTITDGGSITVNAKKLGATVTDAITGNPVGDGSYETLGDAVDAINALTANASVKITLNDAATSDIVLQNTEDANISVVLDLAGKNITGSGESAAAVVVASGSLLITNSTVEVGHVIAASGYPAVAAANADLTIAGGIYDGAIDVSGASSALITGGEFSVNANKDPNDENVPPAANADLKAAAAAAGNELVVGSGSASYYVVVEKVLPTYVAQIGETGYETLAAAVAAARTLSDASAPVTITLLDNVSEAGICLSPNNFSVNGLALDLGGKTYTVTGPDPVAPTVGAVSKDPIDVRTNNIFTVSNGTLAVSYSVRDIVRIYGGPTTVVTFKDVTISSNNLEAAVSEKPVGVLQIEGGSVNIIGSTSINSGSAPYAIKFGNHANATQYECGTVTLNTTGNIVGDILLTGGTYVETAIGGGSSIDYFYGTNVWSTWEDANNVVFAARDGELSATGNENDVSGKLYKTFAEAFAATNEFTLLENYAGNVAFTTATKIKANGYELTGTLTAPAGYVVRLVDGVYQAALPSITCVLGGGTQAAGSDTEYTVNASESQTKTIVEPTSVDSNFTGWVITPAVQGLMISGTTLTIPAGLDLDITLTATWEAKAGYPTYVDPNDADVVAQYTAWANTYVADTGSAYETAFLLNVAPDAADQTLDVTAITISGTTVSITLDHQNLNGYVYVYEADTLAGLDSALPTLVEESAGVITRTSSDSAKFYKIVVSAHPIVAQ